MRFKIIPIILAAALSVGTVWGYIIETDLSKDVHFDFSEFYYWDGEYETYYWGDDMGEYGNVVYIVPEEGDPSSGQVLLEIDYYYKHELILDFDNFEYPEDFYPAPPDPNPFIFSYSEILSVPIDIATWIPNMSTGGCVYYEFLNDPLPIDEGLDASIVFEDVKSTWIEADFASVPEPSMALLLGVSLLGLSIMCFRIAKK